MAPGPSSPTPDPESQRRLLELVLRLLVGLLRLATALADRGRWPFQ
jgi:hypothetical protein